MARVPIPDDWDGTSYCCQIISWPDSDAWNGILLGLLTWPTRGRFWDERTGTVTVAQEIGQEILAKNSPGDCEMGCLEDLQASLDAISSAITASSCCGDIPPSVIGSEPAPGVGEDGTGTPPGDYGTGPTSVSQKCLMSNYYYRQTMVCIESLIDYNVLGYAAIGIAVMTAQLLLILEAVLAASFLAVLFAQFGAMTDLIQSLIALDNDDLQNILDAMEADEEGFVCALYTGEDTGGSRQNVDDWAQHASLTVGQNAVLQSILNWYVLAGLYYPDASQLASAAEITDPFDCAQCGYIHWQARLYSELTGFGGTIVAQTETTVDIQATAGDGDYRAGLFVWWDDALEWSGITESLSWSIISGTLTPLATGNTYRYWDDDGATAAYTSDTPPSQPVCACKTLFLSTTQFTVRFTTTGECTP